MMGMQAGILACDNCVSYISRPSHLLVLVITPACVGHHSYVCI